MLGTDPIHFFAGLYLTFLAFWSCLLIVYALYRKITQAGSDAE